MDLKNLGYKEILEFKQVPCLVYFNPETCVTLSLGNVDGYCWLKASSHFYIKGMETQGETALYSRLQEITKFMEYLKQNVAELHLQIYYISDITPRIAVNNFKHTPQLQEYLAKYDKGKTILDGSDEKAETTMIDQLEFLRKAGTHTHDLAMSELENVLKSREKLREEFSKNEKLVKAGTSILREWVEKGYGAALLWTVSTTIHICLEKDLAKTIVEVEEELKKIDSLHVKSRAYQQQIWIEPVREPFYAFYAEALGLFHPSIQKVYKDKPIIGDFAKKIEDMVNARLALPIHRTNYSEDSSTAVAEAIATFYRQAEKIVESPQMLKRLFEPQKCDRPIFFGFLAYQREEGFELTNYPFIIDIDELRRHALITGSTGGGKTRVGQIIVESTSLHVPTIVIDPVGQLTGMIKPNGEASKEKQYGLHRGVGYDFARIYTLDDKGIRFEVNILERPDVTDDRIVEAADQASMSLCELIDERRLREDLRNILLNAWRNDEDLDFDSFIETTKEVLREKKIGEKSDRLYSYKNLMAKGGFDVESLLANRLSIFDLSSPDFSDEAKLMVSRYIMKKLADYSMGQPHSDELKILVFVDEVHRYYEFGKAHSPALALEALVKEGRGKGIGVVMATQAVKDLGDLLTQANLRIMLKIMQSEIPNYYVMIGDMAKTRALYGLDPRLGYVLYGGKEFFCKFRPTLSAPKGVEDFEDIRKHSLSHVAVEEFKEQAYQRPSEPSLAEQREELHLTPEIFNAIKTISDKGGEFRSIRELQLRLDKGRETTVKLVQGLEAKGYIELTEIGIRKAIRLTAKGKRILNDRA